MLNYMINFKRYHPPASFDGARKHGQLGPETLKPWCRKRFRHDISQLVFRQRVLNNKSLAHYSVTNKVIVNLNMFRSSIQNRIGSKLSGTKIITKKQWWT
ncbi:hypothetical protein TorRG33x02_171910 [Trema orientale]|uniref:Uncharacterized protein n=1 Tax=Trema orientale TaxID=63057 RepID=A0A2P5ENC3_TREOI|nr:hypothetical protein TorRG33x02_171910 [Trema orientale]